MAIKLIRRSMDYPLRRNPARLRRGGLLLPRSSPRAPVDERVCRRVAGTFFCTQPGPLGRSRDRANSSSLPSRDSGGLDMVRSTTTCVVTGGEVLRTSSPTGARPPLVAGEGDRWRGEDNAFRLLFGVGESSFPVERAGAVDLKIVSTLGNSKDDSPPTKVSSSVSEP